MGARGASRAPTMSRNVLSQSPSRAQRPAFDSPGLHFKAPCPGAWRFRHLALPGSGEGGEVAPRPRELLDAGGARVERPTSLQLEVGALRRLVREGHVEAPARPRQLRRLPVQDE